MPVTPTFPGVYIEEIPSGVRTIVGVSTSTTAFLGYFRRGPLNTPLRCFSLGDFDRELGGLRRGRRGRVCHSAVLPQWGLGGMGGASGRLGQPRRPRSRPPRQR